MVEVEILAALLNKGVYNQVAQLITDRYFTSLVHLAAWEKIKRYHLKFPDCPSIRTDKIGFMLMSEFKENEVRAFIKLLKKAKLSLNYDDKDFLIEHITENAKHRDSIELIEQSLERIQQGKTLSPEEIYNQAGKIVRKTTREDFARASIFSTNHNEKGSRLISSGFPTLDRLLGGGSEIPEFGVLMGVTNVGKTAYTYNLAKNYAWQGLNVVIFSTETPLNKALHRLRLCLTEGNLEVLPQRLDFLRKKKGRIEIIDLSDRSVDVMFLPNFLNKYKEFQVVIGDSFDDFRSTEKFEIPRLELKAIYVFIRQIARKYNLLIWNTSQSNRGGYSRKSLDLDNISEDINKIQKPDTVITINQTGEESCSEIGLVRIGVKKSKLGSKGRFREAVFLFQEDAQLFKDMNEVKDLTYGEEKK